MSDSYTMQEKVFWWHLWVESAKTKELELLIESLLKKYSFIDFITLVNAVIVSCRSAACYSTLKSVAIFASCSQ